MAPLERLADGLQAPESPNEFLVLFAHHNMYFNMRFHELESIASILGIAEQNVLYVDVPAPTALSASPLALVRLPGEQAARQLCERSVLIKAILEVWATGENYSDAVSQALAAGSQMHDWRRRFLAPPRTIQIRVVAFGQTTTMDDKRDTFRLLRPLFTGDEIVDLQNPDTTIWALAEYEHHTTEKTHQGRRNGSPLRTFLCRQVAGGRSIDKKLKHGDKAYFQQYDLSQRAVLGPTTLENELAFIMANCVRAQPGQLVLEPFCGTGGLLVALSHFGARLVGGEIDIRVVKGWRVAYTKNKAAAMKATRSRSVAASCGGLGLGDAGEYEPRSGEAHPTVSSFAIPEPTGAWSKQYLAAIGLAPSSATSSATLLACPGSAEARSAAGRGAAKLGGEGEAEGLPDRDIFTNFVQYALPLPEVVLCDNSVRPWRKVEGGWCDGIVTDPPYGVRAGAKKQGREPGRAVEIRDRATYIPPKVSYAEAELARDLLDLASEALRDGGHLVFLAPLDLADLLGVDRAASERGGAARGTLRSAAIPKEGRTKDPRLCVSETSRDPLLLDERRYREFLPQHVDLELVCASLQILSGGLGRLLVTMRRRPREERHAQ